MSAKKHEPILVLRAEGPATKGGRIPLHDLLQMGRNIQAAVERVARVLVGQADSRKSGRKPAEIRASCPLEVVALNRGSFEIALDLPRDRFEDLHLGVEAVEKLGEGLGVLESDGVALPAGYDLGVLSSLRDMGSALGRGIDCIEVETRTRRAKRTFRFDQAVHRRIAERIRGPVTALRTVEGRLLMVDFRHDAERFRIYPPTGESVTCQFDESLEETVYEHLRRFVRVTGETREDPLTGRIASIAVRDIEPVAVEGGDLEPVPADGFWREKTLEQLADEQGVSLIREPEEVWGKAANLWDDAEDFEAFLAATRGNRSEHR